MEKEGSWGREQREEIYFFKIFPMGWGRKKGMRKRYLSFFFLTFFFILFFLFLFFFVFFFFFKMC